MERGMGMEWFIILLIWLVAPFAELAAIIVLSVANSRYKRRIWELTRGADKADTGMQDKGPADVITAVNTNSNSSNSLCFMPQMF